MYFSSFFFTIESKIITKKESLIFIRFAQFMICIKTGIFNNKSIIDGALLNQKIFDINKK